MASRGQAKLSHATSRDGTQIGYFTSGEGPPLVLVHGTASDHTRWDALRGHLEAQVTVHAVDRRGRGASGDGPDYAIEREYEDVAAVIDAVAGAAGCAVDVYGHSYGGVYAFGGAALAPNLRRLVLYEGWPTSGPAPFLPPAELVTRLEALLAEGDREGVVETVARELANMTDEEIAAYRAHPSWPARVAAAHTIPREAATISELSIDPAQIRGLTVPTLLLIGEQSPDWVPEAYGLAEALQAAHVEALDGQGHAADALAPERVAEHVLRFLQAQR
ncbi:MAG: alpha/beta hydrolase [Nitriliruptor sp.]|nr:MAG: alpha/beta hydrolase [Nitriliruptor sp.]